MKKIASKLSILLCFFLAVSLPTWAEDSVRKLIPVGQTVGVTLEFGGVEVVDVVDFSDYDGKTHSPAKDAGIVAGDLILEINGAAVNTTKDLRDIVNKNGEGELTVLYRHDGQDREAKMTPAISNTDGMLCLGIWIKDAASGIGTLTYYDPETGEFGALGHGICDAGTGNIIDITGGDILKSTIVAVQKGEKGQPGELIGVFADGKEKLGKIASNVDDGLKGTIDAGAHLNTVSDALEIATRDEVHEGDAYILSNVEEDRIDRFEVEIQKINESESSSKSMVVKIKDKNLIEKTGGIVQGMSGSPIIQDNKLVGAVTHVFVNDPTRGYGIFISNMLE